MFLLIVVFVCLLDCRIHYPHSPNVFGNYFITLLKLMGSRRLASLRSLLTFHSAGHRFHSDSLLLGALGEVLVVLPFSCIQCFQVKALEEYSTSTTACRLYSPLSWLAAFYQLRKQLRFLRLQRIINRTSLQVQLTAKNQYKAIKSLASPGD